MGYPIELPVPALCQWQPFLRRPCRTNAIHSTNAMSAVPQSTATAPKRPKVSRSEKRRLRSSSAKDCRQKPTLAYGVQPESDSRQSPASAPVARGRHLADDIWTWGSHVAREVDLTMSAHATQNAHGYSPATSARRVPLRGPASMVPSTT